MNNVYEAIKKQYGVMKSNDIKPERDNIMGHIVNKFCKMQNADGERFFDNYDYTTVGGKSVSTCDIMVGEKCQMSILATSERVDKEISIAMLRIYMKKVNALSGIVIVGTMWNLIDANGKEYSMDFADSNATEDDFKRFLIHI